MAKYGKKNKVSENLTDYSICLLGESGIGKTTTIYEMCEKLTGEDGYIILNMGKEDGVACLDGAIYENCETWKKFDDVTKDIVKNKETDYPDLKIVVIDTIDQLFDITEPEVIRRYNQEKMGEKNFKPVKTINAAYGGFGEGLNQAITLVLDKIWELKKAGIAVWMCGHVKAKEVVDPVTDQTYNTLSSLLSQKYFNAIKTKMHVVGMAVIDRNIITESTGRKNIVNKEDITRKKVTSETRKIIFRDDNYGVDSKSRFANIVDEIPLDSDEFIKALKDAIANTPKGMTNGIAVKEEPIKHVEIENTYEEEELPNEEPEDIYEEVETVENYESDDEVPFMNEPEETDYDSMSDDELRTEIRALTRSINSETKLKIKTILTNSGTKLTDASRSTLLEILKITK